MASNASTVATRRRSGALVVVIALLALLAGACNSDGSTGAATDTGITVTGVGRVSVEPDVVVVDLGAETTAETVAEARSEAAAVMNAIRESLAANGVEDRDVSTRSFNIYPRFDYSEGDPELTGFNVSNTVEVRIRAIDQASAIIDEVIVAAGDAIRVHGIRFEVDDPAPHLDAARASAVADARAKAGQLAALAGVGLGAVRTITESAGGGGWASYAELGLDGAFDSADTSIAPGEDDIVVSVLVVYGIE